MHYFYYPLILGTASKILHLTIPTKNEMPMLFIEYAEQLLKNYEAKKTANLLSTLLLDPTTAQLKKACSHVYAERMKKGEKVETNTLIAFFGVPPEGRDMSYVIDRTAADKFRPLQSFMKRRVKIPSSENVELLAWLIDFTPRPWVRAKEVSLKEENIISSGLKEDAATDSSTIFEDDEGVTREEELLQTNPPFIYTSKQKTNGKLKWVAVILLLIVAVFGGLYFTVNRGSVYGDKYAGECMIWMNDHYEKIACSTKRENNRIILPLNEEVIYSFKKINREDTITARSIGKIYYLKIKNKPVFFTQGGYHPIEINRPLKVMSRHIYETHILKKNIASNDLSP